jgi:very-short-patch-repair endonuclease
MFCRRGWLLFQLSADQVKNNLEDVIEGIAEAIEHCNYRDDFTLKTYPKVWSKLIQK